MSCLVMSAKPEYLRPFWQYYGGKWRAAPRYPRPICDTIIEPFAGAAGYSLRHYEKDVLLIERYHVVAEIWRYLISVSVDEILNIPLVDNVNKLPAWVPNGGKWLVGFAMNAAVTAPCQKLSAGKKMLIQTGHSPNEGWSEHRRAIVAAQVPQIRHWRIIEGDYSVAPDASATWFVDPPYNNKKGSYYKATVADYSSLASWCLTRCGQVMVCENEGATWLPFTRFATFKAGINGKGSREVIWTNDQT